MKHLENYKEINFTTFDDVYRQITEKPYDHIHFAVAEYQRFLENNFIYLKKEDVTNYNEISEFLNINSIDKILDYQSKVEYQFFNTEKRKKLIEDVGLYEVQKFGYRYNNYRELTRRLLCLKYEYYGIDPNYINDYHILHNQISKKAPSKILLEKYPERRASALAPEQRKAYIEELINQGIDPITDKTLETLRTYDDAPDARMEEFINFAQKIEKYRNNTSQIKYMLQYKFVKVLYPDFLRLLKYWKLRMDKQEFLDFKEKIYFLKDDFENIIINEYLKEYKPTETSKHYDIKLVSQAIKQFKLADKEKIFAKLSKLKNSENEVDELFTLIKPWIKFGIHIQPLRLEDLTLERECDAIEEINNSINYEQLPPLDLVQYLKIALDTSNQIGSEKRSIILNH